jgi:hypothetical protein
VREWCEDSRGYIGCYGFGDFLCQVCALYWAKPWRRIPHCYLLTWAWWFKAATGRTGCLGFVLSCRNLSGSERNGGACAVCPRASLCKTCMTGAACAQCALAAHIVCDLFVLAGHGDANAY